MYIGQNVFVKKLNKDATILTLPNKNNEFQVRTGIITMNVKIDEISQSSLPNKKEPKTNISIKTDSKAQTVTSQINVIGLNVDEAIPIIDKYLDDASLAKLSSVRIVHGKGTGRLRSGIHNFLKTHSHVKSFRLGAFGEGEMGVTIVEIK